MEKFKIGGKYRLVARDSEGNLKWKRDITNTIVNQGLNDVLNQYLKGSAYSASFFVGLITATPTIAASDTLASNPGWNEFTGYSESTRRPLSLGAVAAQTVNNSASLATFTISADDQTVGGAMIVTDGAKGGTAGTLFSVGAFDDGNEADLDTGDTVTVEYACSVAAS